MFIGVARFDLHLTSQPHSLKEKRSVVRRIKEHLRSRLQLSVAEVDSQDLWQRLVVGVACVSPDQNTARKLLQDASDLLARDPEVEILEEQTDVSSW